MAKSTSSFLGILRPSVLRVPSRLNVLVLVGIIFGLGRLSRVGSSARRPSWVLRS